jgi:tape measure domain-containing protein
MADSSQTLQIIIKLRDQASRALTAMRRTVTGARGAINSLSSAVFSLKGALAGLGLGLVARSFIDTAKTFAQMEIKLDALTKGKGVETLEAINAWALRMPVDTRKAVDSFSMMMAMGLDPTLKKMQTLVDVSVLFGEHAMPRVARALGQMATLGRLSAEELNQLSEVGINARKYLTEAFGKSVEELQKSKVKIGSIIDAILKGLEREFGGSATRMMNSWQGLTTTLYSYWVEFQRRVMKSGVFEAMKVQLQGLVEQVDKLFQTGRIDIWAHEVAIGVLTAFEMMTQAVGYFIRAVISVEGIMDKISAEWKEFKLTGLKAEFDTLFEALEKQDLPPGFKRLYGEDWQGPVEARVRELGKQIQILHREFTDSTDSMMTNAERLERYKQLMDAALAALEKLKQTQYKPPKEIGDIPTKPKTVLPDKPDPKLIAAGLKAEAQEALEVNKTLLAAVNQQWTLHTISMEDYFKQRTDLIAEQYKIQNDLLEAQKKTAKPEQIPTIEARQFALRQQHLRDMVGLEVEYKNAIKDRSEAEKQASDVVAGIRERVAEMAVGVSLQRGFDLAAMKMRTRQQEEIDALLRMKEEGYDVEKELQEAHHEHMLEREQQAANDRKKVWETFVSGLGDTLSSMTDMFLDFYKASGEKNKEMFTLFKAASIARAVIATYESAVKAYNSMVEIPIVGPALAATAAGVAIAAGMAKVQLIRQQEMSEGGVVKGYSPSDKADNIPIKATVGEFMNPVDTVRYYTLRGMEVIRKKLIPKEVLLSYATPTFSVPSGFALAAGGMVANSGNNDTAAEDGSGQSLHMQTNVVLPENLSFIGRRLEAEIEPVIVRVLREELRY